MKLTYTDKGTLQINGMHLRRTSIQHLPQMVAIEVLKVHGTGLIIRDLATRLWYHISTPINKSWTNITLHQFDTFPVKIVTTPKHSYLINLNPTTEII